MNNPARPLPDELARIARLGFEFVDLTLEPPGAWPVESRRVRELLDRHELDVVGHTAWYLPIASPFRELERTARELYLRACASFAEVGVSLVNVHPWDRGLQRDEVVARNADAIRALADAAEGVGLTLMVENVRAPFRTPVELAPLFEAAPSARLHLDVGHANLGGPPNAAPALIEAFADRLAHVHVSDNVGFDDLHLPLATGTVDWPSVVGSLRAAHYDGTVTLEVFSPAEEHVETSRRLWLRWWEGSG
ncbi:MAG: sugar phosphate isomerase/epimerase [Actinomycetota bacterium]|nr:sugar phosphate isomerase/epimerase [Actinomycetota bacterium]